MSIWTYHDIQLMQISQLTTVPPLDRSIFRTFSWNPTSCLKHKTHYEIKTPSHTVPLTVEKILGKGTLSIVPSWYLSTISRFYKFKLHINRWCARVGHAGLGAQARVGCWHPFWALVHKSRRIGRGLERFKMFTFPFHLECPILDL